MNSPIRVTVWGENFHEHSERDREGMAERYPDGMHGAIAAGLSELLGDAVDVRTATQDQPEHGLTADVLDNTDVLTWWGHATHAGVSRRGRGPGAPAGARRDGAAGAALGPLLEDLHQADGHHLLAVLAQLRRRRAGLDRRPRRTRSRPVCRSRSSSTQQEMYGEYFDIPEPDELVFVSGFSGGEVFRSGCCWRRGKGKVFYFSPGRPGVPGLSPSRHQAGARQRGAVGGADDTAETSPPPAVRNEPAPLPGR